jgi:hypothetical protein
VHKNFFCTEEGMEIQRVFFFRRVFLQDAQSISRGPMGTL